MGGKFPDPPNSPGYHTHTLTVCKFELVQAGHWVQAFSRVARLNLDVSPTLNPNLGIFLAPFHNFSSALKSLRVEFRIYQYSQVFDLVCSFPLLEDLALVHLTHGSDGGPQTDVPSVSPAFTGSLELALAGGMETIARRSLDLPEGLRFRQFAFSWWTMKQLEEYLR